MYNSNKKLFFNFAFTYFVIIVFVLISLFPIYQSLSKAEVDKAQGRILGQGQSAMRELETIRDNLLNTSRNLYMDQELKNLYYSSVSGTDSETFYNMFQLQKRLRLYFQNIRDVADVLMYFPRLDYILTPDYIYREKELFYHAGAHDLASPEDEDWLELYCSPEYAMTAKSGYFTETDSAQPLPVVDLFFVFPMAGDPNIPLLIMVSLDASSVGDAFLLPELKGQACCQVLEDGNLIASSASADSGDQDGFFSASLTGAYGMEARIYIDQGFYRSIRSDSLNLIFRSIGLALLIGAAASLYFSWNRSRPLENVLDILRRSELSENDIAGLDGIEDSVVRMASEIRMCRDTIKDLDSMVSADLLERLFFGDFSAEKIQRAFIQYFGSPPSPFVCAAFTWEESGRDAASLKEAVCLALASLGKSAYAVHPRGGRVYLLLQDEEDIQETLEQLLRIIRDNGGPIAKGGVSNPASQLQAVKKAAFQADSRLNAGLHIQGVYLFLRTYSSRAAQNTLNVQFLDSLQRSLQTGNKQTADKLIQSMFGQLGTDRPDAVELRQLFFSLRSVYSAVISQFNLESEKKEETVQASVSLPNDLDEYSPTSIETAFMNLNGAVYTCYLEQLERNKKKKGACVLAYVDENFRDPNLCASSIAQHFNLSEKYIYQLVKDACGETLNDRISFLRVQEGIRLLETTDMTVADVALHAGFLSSNSMYKVFMRVKGVSPSTYKKRKDI